MEHKTLAAISSLEDERSDKFITDDQHYCAVNSVDDGQKSKLPDVPKAEKRRRIALSAGQKKEVCLYKGNNTESTNEDISAHFRQLWNVNFSASTVYHILRVKEKWLAVPDESYNIIRNRAPMHQELDVALYNWFTNRADPGNVISDEAFLNKAHELGKKLNIYGFSYSTGWLYRFKKRHGICKTRQKGRQKLSLFSQMSGNAKVEEKILADGNDIDNIIAQSFAGNEQGVSDDNVKCEESASTDTKYFGEMSTSSYDKNENKPDVTLEEAHKGLENVIKFVESNPPLEEKYLEILQQLLAHIIGHSEHVKEEAYAVDELAAIKEELMTDSDGDDNCEEVEMDHISYEETGPNKKSDDQLLPANQSTNDENVSSLSRCHVCNTCGKGFLRACDLQRHNERHSGKKPHKCKECGKGFADPYYLRIHMRIHTGERPYVCSTCGKGCTTQGNLQMHMRFHTGEKPYTCSVCNKRFAQSFQLTEHVRIHTGERPHECKTCEKRFTRSGELRIHERLHTGERPYNCSVCDKSFSQLCNLKKHQKAHTGEKPYKCVTCGRYFGDKCVLATHQRTHTGERPFCCDVCGKTFSNSGSLHHHGKTHANQHSNGPPP